MVAYRFAPIYLIYSFLYAFGLMKHDTYLSKRWSFLIYVKNLDQRLNHFSKKRQWAREIKKAQGLLPNMDVILSEHPSLIIDSIFSENQIQVLLKANEYQIEEKRFVHFQSMNELLKGFSENKITVYANRFIDSTNIVSKAIFHKRIYDDKNRLNRAKILHSLLFIFLYLFLSFVVTAVCLYQAPVKYGMDLYWYYFENFGVFLLNWLPVLFLFAFFSFLFGRIWAGFFISSTISFLISSFNYFKIMFRNDPLYFSDVGLLSESVNMAGKYEVVLRISMWMLLAFIIIVTILLSKRISERISGRNRIIGLVLLVLIGVFGVKYTYFSDSTYNQFVEEEIVNRWSGTDQYICRGNIYPFIFSIKSAIPQIPEGYQKSVAEQEYFSYEYDDIPEDKKVNVISIMLEAYSDFTELGELEFERDPYVYLHELQSQSYSGNLVTNIFGGGTVNTERSFLTGDTQILDYRTNANSYVRYFADQGYTTEGSHPSYNWFYNRLNVNEYLGFSKYHFYEDRYESMGGIVDDKILMPDIVKFYQNNKVTGTPYFNFSVTYQNHGPYEDTDFGDDPYVLWQQGFNESDYNILNWYLSGIDSTNRAIEDMINTFSAEEEPIVVILFGDHKPWGGNNNSVYEMVGANIDIGTEEGFYNYYETPYIIWANDAAKKTLGNEFVGKGDDISPCFLMNQFFELAGYKGDEFMKISNELYNSSIDVVNTYYYRENGQLTNQLSAEGEKAYDKYLRLQYFRRTNYFNEGSRAEIK